MSKTKRSGPDSGTQPDAETVAAAAAAASAGETAEAATEPPETDADAAEPEQKTEAELAEMTGKYLRAKAELENYRKRVQREFAEIRALARQVTVEEFLPVYDHFQMALQHADENTDSGGLRQGMEMIAAEFRRTLENLGITPIEAAGQPFDPEQHEAIAQEHSDQVPEGQVLRQWKCGFRMADRLLRPAAVVVSAGPAEAEPEQSEN